MAVIYDPSNNSIDVFDTETLETTASADLPSVYAAADGDTQSLDIGNATVQMADVHDAVDEVIAGVG